MAKQKSGKLFFKILKGVLLIVTTSTALFAFLVYVGYEGVLDQIRGFVPPFLFRQVETNIYTTWFIAASSFVVVVILVILFTIIFTKKIITPLLQILEAVEEVGRGNLDVNIKINSGDEFEELADKFNLMIQRLKETQERLEDERTVLEIRVKARTRELEELAQTLEAQVKERTKELERRIKELEKFHRLAVGRELQMIKLKNEIKNLRNKLAKYEQKHKQSSERN